MPNSNSLFQLKKVSSDQLNKTRSQVLTVNFESDGDIQDLQINDYFNSRLDFMKKAYEFAKEAKLAEDFDFADNKTTQEKLQTWLKEKYPNTQMITGSEFGVITTKIIESIKSAFENEYLKKLAEDLRIVFYQKKNPDFNPNYTKLKPTKQEKIRQSAFHAEAKNYQIGRQELKELSQTQVQQIFRYEEVQKAENILQLLIKIQEQGVLVELCDKTIKLIQEFIESAKEMWSVSYENVSGQIQTEGFYTADLARFYVQKLYFTFDVKVREIENRLFPEINQKLNIIKQQFGLELVTLDSFSEIQEDKRIEMQKNCYNIWNFDWVQEISVKKWVLLIEKIKNTAKDSQLVITKDDYGKDDNFFLRHPKSAPSFPSIKDKIIEWEDEKLNNRAWTIISKNSIYWNDLKFWDYLFARVKRLIEQSDGYRVWQFIKPSKDLLENTLENQDFQDPEWIIWLDALLNKQKPEFNSFNQNRIRFPDNKSQYQVGIISFIWEKDRKLNKGLPQIYIAKYQETHLKTNLKSKHRLETKEPAKVLEIWLEKHFEDLSRLYPEIAFLLEIQENNLFNTDFYKAWKELLSPIFLSQQEAKENSKQKLAVKTVERQKAFEKKLGSLGYSPVSDPNSVEIQKLLLTKLARLEKHLLLDQSHQEFYIFDKVSFKKYQNLAQIGFEAALDKKQILQVRSKLAELTKERKVVLPFKIDRMTNRTNGNSGVVYEYDIETRSLTKNSFVLVYPTRLNIKNGSGVSITDDYQKVVKELNRPENIRKYERVLVGFLNGDKDNRFSLQFVNVTENTKHLVDAKTVSQSTYSQLRKNYIAENDKGYAFFDTFELVDTKLDVYIQDPYRTRLVDQYGGTNPSGYPKLYYFLIPKICTNLIIPIKTHSYYLTKYSPYAKLADYLELEEELNLLKEKTKQNTDDTGLKAELELKAKEILDLRCKLRAYYRLSSIELDLIRSYRLVTDKHNKLAFIGKKVKAAVHLQIQNPEFNSISNYNKEINKLDLMKKYNYLLSVDLGEKILASCSLSAIDWENFDNANFGIKQKARFFLPLRKNFEYKTGKNFGYKITKNDSWKSTNLGNKYKEKQSAFAKFLQLLDESNYLEINSKSDISFEKYIETVKAYHRIQKVRGVVSDEFKNSRKNLTDQLAQLVATQIAVLAKKYKALVVFENLTTGFGRQAETVKLYTEIKRLVIKKLGKLGMIDLSSVKTQGDFDKIGLRNGNIEKVVAAYTSKTCSNCGYLPAWFKPESKKEPAKNGIKVLDTKWQTDGMMEYQFQDHTFFKLELTDKDVFTWKTVNILKNGHVLNVKPMLEKQVYFYKKNTSVNQKSWIEMMQNYLFSKKEGKRVESKAKLESFHKFALKTFLNPRNNQETFVCPCCGHTENADYQAAWNIGLKLFEKLKSE